MAACTNSSAVTAETVDVTLDGRVRKRVLKEGTGDPPPLHARCLVHYVGRLAASSEQFMDTRAESSSQDPIQIVAGRDASLRQTGLNLAVLHMRRGEKCLLQVKPEYGYGRQGSFSFPTVPPDAALEYEVELIEFDAVEESMERGAMTYEERLEAAERRRLEGNAAFRVGENADALGKYAMGLSYMNEDFLFQLEGPHLDKANAVRHPILLNMAAAQLRLGDCQGAVASCSQVLMGERSNAKALFRRGKARHLLGQTDEAMADLVQAAALAPSDPAIVKEIQALKSSIKAEQKASDRLFRGQFASSASQKLQNSTNNHSQQQLSGLQHLWQGFLSWLRTLLHLEQKQTPQQTS